MLTDRLNTARPPRSRGSSLQALAGLAVAVAVAACGGARQSVPAPAPSPVPVRAVLASGPDSVAPVSTERVEIGDPVLESAQGEATYYADRFDGRRAASGVVFRNSEAWAAHRTYPFGTLVRVTNLANERSVVVRIVDRGPHGTSPRAQRTIIDLSQSAARSLDFIRAGRTPVLVEVLEWGTGGALQSR